MAQIRTFNPSDFDTVKKIYQEGIDTGNATFQTRAKDWEEWNAAMLPVCRLVAEAEDKILGWAALSPVSSRRVYSGVAEVSIYVAKRARGKGIGRLLLEALISASEKEGIWTLQAGIFPENRASLALHESLGFRVLGVRKKIGEMNGVWRDVVLLERRSTTVGIS